MSIKKFLCSIWISVCAPGSLALSAVEGLPAVQVLDWHSGLKGSFPFLKQDQQGRFWAAMRTGSLFVGDGARFLEVPLPPELGPAALGGLEVDAEGRVWVLSSEGLGCLNQGTWRTFPSIRMKWPNDVTQPWGLDLHPSRGLLAQVSRQAYLIPSGGQPIPLELPGTKDGIPPRLSWRDEGLVAQRGRQAWAQSGKAWLPLPDLLLGPVEQVGDPLRVDRAGHLYALTNRKLYHLPPGEGRWREVSCGATMGGAHMNALGDGRIWLVQRNSIRAILAGQISTSAASGSLSLYGGHPVCLDREGACWISSTSLIRFPAIGLIRVHDAAEAPLGDVWKALRDRRGRLWVASGKGLSRQDDSRWRIHKGLPAMELTLGTDGRLYAQSLQRLMSVDPDTMEATPVNIPAALGGPWIRRGPLRHGEELWVISRGGQLLRGRQQSGRWAWSLDTPMGVDLRQAATLSGGGAGPVWLLLQGRTLTREVGGWQDVSVLKGRTLASVDFSSPTEAVAAQYLPPGGLDLSRTSQGWTLRQRIGAEALPNASVAYAARKAPSGALWLTTDKGVYRQPPGGPALLQRIGMELGLPSEDHNQDALFVESPEQVWVGSPRGLVEIRWGAVQSLPDLLPPLILEARCGNVRFPAPAASLTLPWGRGLITWDLGVPGLSQGEGAHFQFRRRGGSWTDLTGSALQIFDIAPGRHVIEVRMMSALSLPGPSRSLELNVLPPWYRHPVALGIWGGLLIGAIYLSFRWRLRTLQHRNHRLRAAVAQATADLQAQKEALEEMNNRLQDLNEAKKRVIGLAAHDLRNPLSGILLNCALMEEIPEVEAHTHSIGQIRTLGGRMQTLIQGLLDVHAIEAGHAETPRIAPVALRDVVHLVLEQHRLRALQKDMVLVLEGEEAPVAQGDANQLGQILDNLVSNALKYASPGTQVTLRLLEGPKAHRIEVQDQGPGLTPEDMKRVFGEYARLSARPTGGETSVGLGLALVKRLTEGMGGRLGVESEPGHGATFWLELPKAEA